MLKQTVSERLLVAAKIVEEAVDGLMAMTCINLGSLVRPRNKIVWTATFWVLVGAIGFHHLRRTKHVKTVVLEDLQIRPGTTSKWTIHPNNMACLNADSNLISNARAIELVRKPSRTERCRLLNSAIRSINRNLASPVSIAKWSSLKSVAPADLTRNRNSN